MGLNITKNTATPTGTVTMILDGSVDNNTCMALDREIAQACTDSVKMLIFDMQKVSFVSSAGIGILIKSKESLKSRGIESSMINVQAQVKRVFEIMQLLPTMNIFENRSELDAYLVKIQNRILDEGTSISTQE